LLPLAAPIALLLAACNCSTDDDAETDARSTFKGHGFTRPTYPSAYDLPQVPACDSQLIGSARESSLRSLKWPIGRISAQQIIVGGSTPSARSSINGDVALTPRKPTRTIVALSPIAGACRVELTVGEPTSERPALLKA